MAVIWKFPLDLKSSQFLTLPRGGEILTVQMQQGRPCLWVRVDPEARPLEARAIFIVGTGHEFDERGLHYVGTVQQDLFVWHVFIGNKE